MPATVTMSVPAAVSQVRRNTKPKFSRSKNGRDVLVSHREYIGRVNGATIFANASYPINPGLPQTFPWLSSMAPLYESYKFESLRFEYVPACSSSTAGTIGMGVDYNPSDPLVQDEVQLLNWEQAVSGSSWTPNKCVALREEISKRSTYYVRTGGLAAGQDINLYDTGNLQICSLGQVDTSSVGQLFIDYRVRLMTPQMDLPGLAQAKYFRTGIASLAGATVSVGNAPLTAVNNAGVITFTALAPYQGLFAVNVAGTGLTVPTIDVASTAPTQLLTTVQNAAATASVSYFEANFQRAGQTVLLSTLGTTVSNSIRIGQYAYANT